jgi:hypothetical protein
MRPIRGLMLIAPLLLLLAACARPVGDLGRVDPDYLHDTVMPAIGKARAEGQGVPRSRFNRTDQETEMLDRIWRFLVAPRTADWFASTAAELQRTGITGPTDTRFRLDGYYRWLHDTAYQSSSVRYATLAADVEADLATLPPTFKAICAVEEVDRERAVAAAEIGGLAAGTDAEVAARKSENLAAISWFTRALGFRYRAYSYALDHLLVETPSPAGRRADHLLADMQMWVHEAEAGRFCGAGRIIEIGQRPAPGIPSRYGPDERTGPIAPLPPPGPTAGS